MHKKSPVYVDPSGEQYFGYDEGAYYRMIEAMQQRVFHEWYSVYELAVESVQLTIKMACCLYSHGPNSGGNGSGNHGGETIGVDLKTFKDKCKELGITPGQAIPKDKITNEFIKKFQETFFPNAPMEYVKEFLVEGLDKKGVFLTYGIMGDAKTISYPEDGLFSGYSSVYFNEDRAFNSPEDLFYIMGHELVHVAQFISLKGNTYFQFDYCYQYLMDCVANTWIVTMGGNPQFGFDRLLFQSCIKEYSNYYNCLYSYYDWLYNIPHP